MERALRDALLRRRNTASREGHPGQERRHEYSPSLYLNAWRLFQRFEHDDESETQDYIHQGWRQIIRDAQPGNWMKQIGTLS